MSLLNVSNNTKYYRTVIPYYGTCFFYETYDTNELTWNGNSFFDKFYKVQNFFPYAIPIVLDNEPPRM